MATGSFTIRLFALCFTISGIGLAPLRANALPLDTTVILQDWAQVVDPYAGIDGQGWSAPDSTTLRGLFDTSSTGAIVSPFQVQDMVFETDVLTTGDNDHLGVVLGYQDPDNLYYVIWSGPASGVMGVQVRRKVAGVDTILFDSPGDVWVNNVIHTIRVERSGNDLSFRFEKDGVGVLASFDTTDTTFLSGSIGFWTGSQNADFLNPTLAPEPDVGLLLATGGLALGMVGWRRRAGSSWNRLGA
jgi:hypothetical protein